MPNLVRYYFRKLGANFVDFKLDYPSNNLSLIGSDVVYVGSSGVDRVYVAKGVKFTFNNSGTGTDEIYLDGSFADYSLTAIGTSTLLLTSTAKANTSITLASEDKVFFSDGSSGVKSLITYAAARIGTPSTPPPTLNTAENSLTLPSTSNLDSILRAYTKDPAGVVFAQPHAGVEFILTGHNGVDKVYVSKGGKVNANNLGTGVDLIYLTGNKNEYSPTAVGTSVLVLTKGTERVTLASEDRVIFADGSTLVKAAITAASGANWQALSLDSNIRTPGLVTDTQAPAMPTLALGAGVSGGATAAEATAATGVVSVLAESGSTVLLTFSDSASPVHTLVKTVTGNGSAQSVQLDSTDIGTGPASLQDGSITISATATDAAGNTSTAGTASFTLDTLAPSISSSATATSAENAGAAQVVYTALATDQGAISYSLKPNTGDASAFSIDSSTGAVTLTANPDFETKPSYSFTVVATDAAGNPTEKPVTLAISNVDEVGPVFSSSGSTATAIAENSGPGQVVYTATATDSDFNAPATASSVTYSLKPNTGDASAFSIDSSTGAVTLTTSPDFETKPSYSFTVVATDAAGNPTEKPVTLAISNVNEAPTVVVPQAAITVNEDSSVAIVGISVSDVDAGVNGIASVQLAVAHGTLSVSANVANGLTAENISGNNSASITLIGTQAAINATLASLGYLGNANFNGTDTLSVQSRDGGNPAKSSSSNSVSINVTAINDAPTINGIPANPVDISNAVATALADFSVSDVDGADTTLYVTLTPSNGSIGGFSAGNVPGLSTSITGNTVQLTGTAVLINSALTAARFTPSATGTASLAVRVSDASLTDTSAATSASTNYRFTVSNTPILEISSGQDAYLNNAETSVAVELRFDNLAANDTVQLLLGGSAIGSVHIVSAAEATAQKISLTVAKTDLGADGSKSISAEVMHNGSLATSNALTLTLDTGVPNMPALAIGSGVSGDASSAEATAGNGLVSVTADSDSTVRVTFSDSASHSVIKTLVGSGTAQGVLLADSDLGSGAAKLQDGNISVSATATDAAGNTSTAASSSFTLDTQPPVISTHTFSVNENTQTVGTAAISNTDTVAWALESNGNGNGNGNDNALFAINSASGAITWLAASGANFEAATKSAAGSNSYTLNVSATDAAGNKSTQAITVNLTDVNEAPVTVVPAAAVTVDEDTQIAIAGISVSDVDAGANGIALVQLTVAHGTLSVSSNAANGLTAAGISGNNSANLTLSGTQTAINATLASLGYQGNPNFNGTDTLSVQTSDGGSPALSNSNSVSINVTAVNDAPSISGIPADTVTISNAVATALADFSVSDVDAANTMLYVTLQPSNGSIGGFTDGTVNGLTVHQMSGMVHLTGTAALINTALAAASFTASAAGTASIAVRVSEVSLDDSAAATSSSAGYRFNVLNTPVLSLSSGQDAYINNAETGVDVEVTFGTLASGDTVQLKQGGSAIGSVHTVSQNEAAAQKISLSIAKVDLGADGSKTISAEVTHSGDPSTASNALTLTLDTTAPDMPALALGSGVSNGATSAEATAPSGVVTVTAELASSVALTFTDSVGHSVTKMLTGTGTALAVTLHSLELGSGAASLQDGHITVYATATDAAGNSSAAGEASFALDTSIATPEVTLGTGVSDGATAAEASAATGVVSVNAESGSTVLLTFTDSASPAHSVVKTITSSGTAQGITLDAADIGSGAASLHDGSISVSASATDAAGNVSSAGSGSFTLDTAIATPELTLGAGVSGGASAAEATASSGVILVNAESGSSVLITFTDSAASPHSLVKTVIGSGTALGTSLDSSDIGGAASLQDGTITVSASATDRAGNVSMAGSSSFTLDTLAPAAPTLRPLGMGVSGGATATEATVADGVVIFNAERGSTLRVTLTGTSGTVTKSISDANTVFPGFSNVAGELGEVTGYLDGSFTAKLGDGSPAFRAFTDIEDLITTLRPSVGLSPAEEAILRALPAPGRLVLTSADLTTLGNGTISISTTATDAAGNVSPAATGSFTLDTVAPTLAITSSSSLVKAGQTATITFTFSEDPGSSFDASDITLAGNGTLGTLSGGGATRTAVFTPTADVVAGSASISVANGTFTDAAGNLGTGGSAASISINTKVPSLTGASLQGATTLNLTFDTDLDSAAFTGITTADLNALFSFQTAPSGGGYTTVSNAFTGISVSGSTVTLTLVNSAYTSGDLAQIGYTDPTGDQSTGVVQDAGGNDLASITDRAVITTPVIFGFAVSDTVSSNGTALGKAGEAVTVAVTFSENVTLTASKTYTVRVQVGSNASEFFDATLVTAVGTQSPSSTYSFSGTLPSTTGLSTSTLQLTSLTVPSGASIVAGSQSLTQTTYTLASTAYTVDSLAPTVSSIALVAKDEKSGQSYAVLNAGDTVDVAVTFSEAVTITGSPTPTTTVKLTVGSTERTATYLSNDARNTGTVKYFRYTVQDGETDSDGIAIPANALALGSTLGVTDTITDTAGNNATTITSAAVAANSAYSIDNTAPAFSSGATATAIAENSAAGQVVYTAVATDSAATLSYSLKVGNDASAFSINSSTGAVTLTGSPDFEAKPSYSFTVIATDAAGNASEQAVTLAVTNVDETAPTFSSAIATTIAENSGAGQVVYTAAAADTDFIAPNTAASVSYSLKANTGDVANFTINSSTGAVTLTGSPDFEAKPSYSFTVIATDAVGNASEQVVTLAVTNVNEAPVNTVPASALTAITATALTISGISVSDMDAGSNGVASVQLSVAHGTVSVTSGVSGGLAAGSAISGSGTATLTLTGSQSAINATLATLSYTSTAGHTGTDTLTVLTTDGGTPALTDSDTVSINVTAADTTPPTVSSIALVAKDEKSGQSYAVLNAGDTVDVAVTFSEAVTITGSPTVTLNVGGVNRTATFDSSIDGTTSSKKFFRYTVVASDADANGISIDANALTLNGGSITDPAGNAATITYALVADNSTYSIDNTAPTFSSGATATATAIAENTAAGQLVYTATASDTGSATISYSLKAGTGDVAAFSINSSTGAVTLTGSPDFEAKPSYSFTVVATDAAGNASEQAVTLAVTNVDDTEPTFSSGAIATAIAENSAAGSVVYTAAAADTDFIAPNTASSVSYSLKAGNDASAFTINSNTGAVTLTASPNFEAKPNYSFTVIATDAAGNAREQEVTLAVTNVNEAPVNTVPASALTAITATALTISGISVSDVDAGSNGVASVRLSVAHGTVSVTSGVSGGLVAGSAISGSGTATLTLTGSQSAINATLATLSYTSTAGHTGADTLTVLTTDGGTPALTDSDTVSITVTAAGTTPVVSGFVVSDVGNSNGANLGKGGETVRVAVTFSEAVTLTASSTYTVHVQIGSNASDGFDAFFDTTGLSGSASLYTFTGTLPSSNTNLVTSALQLTTLSGPSIRNASNTVLTQSSYSLSSNAYTVDTAAPVIAASPSLALKTGDGTAATGDIGAGGQTVLTIDLGEAAANLTGLPTLDNSTIIKVNGTGKSAAWTTSGNNLVLTYTAGSSDNGAITVDATALKTALAGITDSAGNAAMIGGSTWATGSFTAPTTSRVVDSAKPVLDLNGAADGVNNVLASNIGNSATAINLSGGPAGGAAPYIDLPDVLLGGDLTLEAWVNFSAMRDGQRVFDIGNGNSNNNLILLVNANGATTSSIRVGGTAVDVPSPAGNPALVAGQWYHLALVVTSSTQKVFVNGVEWSSGGLPAGFSTNPALTRTNTWIGRSNFGEPNANMQIRDVRIYDDARTTGTGSELASDMNGTPVDTTDTNLRLAYKFDGNLQSSLPNGLAATAMNFLTADSPQFLAPNATLSETGNVQSVQVTVSGVRDSASEKLSAGGSSIAADGSVTSGTVTVAANGAMPASTWTWAYVAGAVTGTGTFTFTATAAGGVSSSAAQNLLRSLAYSDTATTPTAGSRGFSITATDVVGNTSTAVTATLNRALTSQIDLDNTSNGNNFSNPALNVSVVNTAQGSPIAPNAALLTSDTSVSRIQVRLGGAGLDLVNDKLVLNGTAAGGNPVTVALNVVSSSATDISIGGIGGLRYSYNSTSKLLIITATSGSIAAADVDDIVKALVFRNALVSPRITARTFEVSVVNMAGEGTSSTSTLTLVDNVVPVAPTLTLGSGVVNGATLAEATAATGVVLVNAESGSTVRVTFTDSSIPVNSFVKTVTGTGSVQGVTLDATDLGNLPADAGKLHDGTINVSAVATDVNGNASAAVRTSLILDTQAPPQPILNVKSGQDQTINSSEASIDIEASYTVMVAGDVITLFNGASAMGSAYMVAAADVAAGKATINVLSSLLGADGSKNITARVTDAAGNPSIDSAGLVLTVDNTAPGIVIKAGQDAYVNASETSIDLEVRTSTLAAGDTIQLKLDGSNLGTAYTVLPADVTARRVSFAVQKTALGNTDGSKSITADYSHAGAAAVTSPALTLTLDTATPSSLVLAVKSGENATINATEPDVNLELTGSNIAEGDLVTLKNGNTILVNAYPVTAADVTAGKVALTVPATALGVDGVKSLTAEVRDAAGNSGTSGTLSVTLDTQGPLLGLQPGSGADAFINSAEAAAASGVSVSVTGVSVGDVITIKEGATVLSGPTTLTAAMITAGTYSPTFARSLLSLGDGIKTLSLQATDAAGNAARANQLDLLVDSTAPAALSGVTTPRSLAENTINVGTALTLPSGASAWQIGGTDARFFMVDGNQLRFITAPDADRPRGLPFNAVTNANAYSITLTAVDAAGNTANGAAAQAMTVNVTDVVTENAPVLNLQPGRSGGVSLAETSSGLGVLAVAAAANATVTVVFSRSGGGTVTKTLTQDASGAPTVVLLSAADLATLGDGSISVTSSAGAVTGLNTVTFTLETTAPTGVSLTVNPPSNSVFDTATHSLTLTANFTGLADGDTLTLLENGVALKQTFTVSNGGSGTQTLTLERAWLSLGDGVKTLTLVATDTAGNSTASTALNLTVDTTAAPTLRSNALIGGVDSLVNRLQLAVDDAVGNDSSTSNGVSTSPYIHITWLDAGSSWQYSLDSGGTWITVAAHNARATDATLALPASNTAYASGAVQVRQIDNSGLTSPITSNSMAFTITPTMTVSGALDDVGNASNTSVSLQAVPARYLRITTNTANQSLNWSDLRVWVMQNGIETELTRSGWVFSGSPGGVASNLTDASTSTAYNAAAVGNGTWLQADLGGYYSVSRVQLINTDASASNQTVSLSINDMGASGIGVGHLLADATVQNFNTGTLGNNSTLTLKPSLATDDSTPTLQGKLASSAALLVGTEYAVYITNLDNAAPAPSKLAGMFTLSGSDWSFTPTTALSDGRYAFALVRQATGNSSFSHATVVPSASSLVLNIDNNGAAANPVLDLNGSAVSGNNTSVDSFIGSRSPVTLTGGPAGSTTAPYVNLPDVSLGNDLTLQAWVNFSTLAGSRVFDIGNGTGADNLILAVQSNGTALSSIRVGATAADFANTVDATHPALVTGQWYHMALVVSGSTQKVFVNGVEWLSGTLPGNFASNASITRTNTWVGRSAWPEPFTAMQVRDVRVYDDARTAAELRSDMNGTPVDVTDPNLRLAYKLQGNSQSSIPGQADAELVNFSSASNSVLRLASNAVLSDASLIASITVAVNSVPDGAAEKILVDGNELAANGAVTSGTLTACNAQWNWTYAAAGFTFTAVGNANGGGGVPATLAQAFVQSLAYQNTALPATIGTRSFDISTTDVFGHLSSVATATLQDATLPGISNLPITGLLLLPNQDTDLADLVFNKGGDPDYPGTINLTVQATNASISGLTDSDGNSANGIQLQGTAAELSNLFASARIRPAVVGGLPGLTLTLSEGANRSVTASYPLIGDDTISPVLDLNGAANNGFNSTPVNILGTRNPINLTGGAAGSTTAPFVDLPDVALGGDFTLEAQVNFSSLFDWERVFDIGNGANSSNVLLGVQADGRVSLSLRNGSTVLVDTASTLDATHPPLITGQWYHLALVVSGTTAKAYVNGVEWVSGTLSATVSNTTRTNTWIGKSAWANDAFSNMQVKDVRVYDDARTAAELISDKNGDTVDTADTELRLAYPLLGDGKSSIGNQADATLTNLGTVASIPVALAPSATLTENSNVSKVQVSIAGILDSTAEKLWVGNTALAADGSGTSGSVTVGTVTWTWDWAAASGFTFTAPGTGVTALQAQGLLQAFGYSVNGPSSIGDRVVSITATDVYNRTSSAVTASLLDPTVPGISNLPSMALIASRTPGTPTPLADLVFNKGGNTTTSLSFNVTITATNGSVDGVTDEDSATAGIQISGTPAELGTKFQNATFQADPSGVPSLSLVLRDSANHTATLTYPLTVDDLTPPVLDLNGAPNGNDTVVGSIIGSNRPINLTGGAANSPSAPYLDLPDVRLGNDLTLQAWVNFSTLDGSRVFDIGNGENADNLILGIQSNGKVLISLRVGGTSADFENTIDNTHPALVTGQWYHLALVVSGNTQKAYVNGVEWLSGTLPAGFASNSSSTRTNTWIGKSAWTEPFTNMQIRDVRIFDDARTLGEVSADAAGITPVDTKDPNLRLAYALNGNVQSSLPSGTPATAVNLNLGYSPQVLAPGATLNDANTVRSLQIRVSGILGGSDEKLIVAGTAIAANGTVTSGALLSGSTPWNWTYAVATSTFTFTAPTGGVSSAVAQDLLRSLAYNDTSAIQQSGNRTVTITATDIFGHTSTAATATLDTALPGINNMPTNPLGVARSPATATNLADLVFTKGGNTSAIDVLSVTVVATNATIGGLTDLDNNAANGIQLSGTAAALTTQFAAATLTANASGTPTLNLTLGDAVGHTTRYNYPVRVTASETTLPLLDLNGSTAATNNLLQGSGIGNTQPFNLTGGTSTSTTAAYVALPNVPLGGDLTLEARVNFTKLVGGGRVFDIGNGFSSSNLILTVNDSGRAIMSLRNGNTTLFNDQASSQALVPGTWYHLALVVNGSTAKIFVDGVEWASGTLSAPITDMTRANTWIGRSNFGEAFSNMQVKDVRVFDDARTTGAGSELASDVSGTAVDPTDPNLRLAYALEGSTASSIPGGLPAEAVNLLASNTGTPLAPAAVLTDDSPIQSFSVGVSGLSDGADEKLMLGNTSIALDGSNAPSSLTVGADSWTLAYANNAFTFTAPTGGVPNYTVQGLLPSLKYTNTDTTATGGTRVFSITATDIYNNVSAAATSSIDTGSPSITNLPPSALTLTRGTAIALADLLFDRGGNTSSADTLTLSIFAVNGTIGGLTDTDANADGIQLTGTTAQLATAFTPTTFTAAASGTPALLFNLTDAVGHSVNYQYPLSA